MKNINNYFLINLKCVKLVGNFIQNTESSISNKIYNLFNIC